MTTSLETNTSNYPCTICMGFCLEDENCIQCDTCINWFHKECVNLSNKRFRYLSDNQNAKFKCVPFALKTKNARSATKIKTNQELDFSTV